MGIDVDRVIREATTAELAALVCGVGWWHTAAVERLGVPALRLADGPHGLRVASAGGLDHAEPATCFPTAVGLASTWNPGLLRRVGRALAAEALALGVDVVLGPGMNIKRSPLGGRNFEYFSEDPLVSGILAGALVEGLQAGGVGACLKHFAANNQETDRMRIDARVTGRALREIYLSAFEYVVRTAEPWTIMASYNRINGTFAAEDPWLLTDVLRDEWGFGGLVMSDWGAVVDRIDALAAGLDLEMPHEPGRSDAALVAAVDAGTLSREVLELSAARVLDLVNRRLAAPDAAGALGHHELAREAALESLVLLRNDGVLPLAAGIRVALVGEFARTPRFQGGGSSKVVARQVDCLRDTLAARRPVLFAPGFTLSGDLDDDLVDEALAAAEASDVIVACLGLPDAAETEGVDRTHLRLPDNQLALLAALTEVGRPVVVVLSNGAAVDVAAWHEDVAGLLEGWLAGEAGAAAVADVLVGDAEPSGRLTETWALALEDHPSTLMFPGEAGRVVYGEDVFVGYRGFDRLGRAVAYPFGFGLGYTTVRYDALEVQYEGHAANGTLRAVAAVTVTNTGERPGAEVVQVYVGDPEASLLRPPRELRAFAKVRLEPGETRTVRLALDQRAFAFWSEEHERWVVEAGDFAIAAGPHVRELPLECVVTIDAPAPPIRLDRESTLEEWLRRPDAFEALQARIEAREGVRWQESEEFLALLRGQPLRRYALFPGGPLRVEDVDAVLATHA